MWMYMLCSTLEKIAYSLVLLHMGKNFNSHKKLHMWHLPLSVSFLPGSLVVVLRSLLLKKYPQSLHCIATWKWFSRPNSISVVYCALSRSCTVQLSVRLHHTAGVKLKKALCIKTSTWINQAPKYSSSFGPQRATWTFPRLVEACVVCTHSHTHRDTHVTSDSQAYFYRLSSPVWSSKLG